MPLRAVLVASVALLMVVVVPGPAARAVEIPGAGMCNGRTDPNLLVIAHANGNGTLTPKYILNLSTDPLGAASGSLILGRGTVRLTVEEWCRAWRHLPGQPPGPCGEYPEGAITAHAVGWGRLRDGQRVLVRTDVRGTSEGDFFRLRYRLPAGHDDGHDGGHGSTDDEGGCDDAGWVRFPAHGWYRLDMLRVRVLEIGEATLEAGGGTDAPPTEGTVEARAKKEDLDPGKAGRESRGRARGERSEDPATVHAPGRGDDRSSRPAED